MELTKSQAQLDAEIQMTSSQLRLFLHFSSLLTSTDGLHFLADYFHLYSDRALDNPKPT